MVGSLNRPILKCITMIVIILYRTSCFILCVVGCVHMCLCMCLCVNMQNPGENAGYPPLSHYTFFFFFETSPLTESAACCFSWTSWPVSSGHPPVSTPGTGVKGICCHAQLLCDAGELTSRSPISTANTHPPSYPPSLKHPS